MSAAAFGYDLGRRNDLIDKYYRGGLGLDEARELRDYIQRDVNKLQQTGADQDDLVKFILLLAAIGGLLYLLGRK